MTKKSDVIITIMEHLHEMIMDGDFSRSDVEEALSDKNFKRKVMLFLNNYWV